MNWLDIETRALLHKDHDEKLAPPAAGEFALVMLRKGEDEARLVRAIHRTNEGIEAEAKIKARRRLPVLINQGMKEEEAIYGQFELICCDSISVFFRSEILQQVPDSLRELYVQVLKSPEFALTRVEILNVPDDEQGHRFVDQFLGGPFPGHGGRDEQFAVWVPFKKARIMKHWASRIGALVNCEAVQDATGGESSAADESQIEHG